MTKVALVSTMIFFLMVPRLWATTGQEPHPPTNLEIPFLDRDAMGARWTAMGGASMAAVDDGSAHCRPSCSHCIPIKEWDL